MKRMIRRTLLYCCALALLLGVVPRAQVNAEDRSLVEIVRKSTGSIFQLRTFDTTAVPIGVGTGFLISSDGYLVTNYHVIDEARRVEALSDKSTRFEISCLAAADITSDLAILKIEAPEVTPLQFADPTGLEAGTAIVVIGNPLGLQSTVSQGIVSAIRTEPIEGISSSPLLQLTAPISSGSSGSPVLDMAGHVVAVVTMTIMGEAQNINFAIPVNVLKPFLDKARASACVPLDKYVYVDRSFAEPGYDPDKYRACPTTQNGFDDAEHNALGGVRAWQSKAWAIMYSINKHLAKRCPHLYDHYFRAASAAAMVGRSTEIKPMVSKGVEACTKTKWRGLEKLDPASQKAACWDLAGGRLIEAKAFPYALEFFRNSLQLNPHSSSVWAETAFALWKIGDVSAAERAYVKALETASEVYEKGNAVSAFADFYIALGKLDEAKSQLSNFNVKTVDKTTLHLFPWALAGLSDSWRKLGASFVKTGERRRAVDAYKRAIDLWERCSAMPTHYLGGGGEDRCGSYQGMGSVLRSELAVIAADGHAVR